VYSSKVRPTTQNDALARETQLQHLRIMKNDTIAQYRPNSMFAEELMLAQDEDVALRSCLVRATDCNVHVARTLIWRLYAVESKYHLMEALPQHQSNSVIDEKVDAAR
jgi:hypothetical protein